jgi:hypothetical protein
MNFNATKNQLNTKNGTKDKRMTDSNLSLLFTKRLLKLSLLSVLGLGLGVVAGCSDVGEQDDPKPRAVATILGASSATTDVTVRSGADVVVTGKDSDGRDDPILDFDIQATSVVGDANVTIEVINSLLIERTLNTKVFRAPSVTEETVVIFEVKVTDSKGVSAIDSTSVIILPVGDSNTFLTRAAVTNSNAGKYELVVALDLDPGEETASSFGVQIETIAEWTPRAPHDDCNFGTNSDRCQLLVNTEVITGDWQTGLTAAEVDAADATTAAFNPHYLIDMPTINFDVININFETVDRVKRLELENISSAKVFHRYTFQDPDNNARLLVLDQNGNDTGLLVHRYKEVLNAPSGLVDVDSIRALNFAESVLSAQAYYRVLDPQGDAETLDEWLQLRGFVKGVGQEPNFAHGLYLNNYDLGFGRDMFMRTDECGNVYTYVENYPSLELGIKKQDNFATVVMEYSPLLPGTPGSCTNDEKFVKFFAYVPDDTSGEEIRMPTMNFDGRGEKSVPGVCTACHGGGPEAMVSFVADHVEANGPDLTVLLSAIDALTSEQKLALVDLNATFMPFDLDSFLFTSSIEIGLTDPFYDRQEISAAQVSAFSREAQLSDFLIFNKSALRTYLHKQQGLIDVDPEVRAELRARWDGPISLINNWYGTSITSLDDIDELDGSAFNGAAIPDGWLGNAELYHDVYAQYCRACHIQMVNTELSFNTLDEFLDTATPDSTRLEDIAFKRGAMPLARLTMDRFWVDFNGGDSAASLLQTAISSSRVPGAIEADFDIDNTAPDALDLVVQLDSMVLGQVDSYVWSSVNDCASDAFLNGSNTSAANFITDISPCSYDVTLDVANAFGADSITKTIVVDRTPSVIALIVAATDDYDPNDGLLTVDIDSLITGTARADSQAEPLDIVINDTDEGLAINSNTALDSNGDVAYSVSVFDGVTDTFTYKLSDINASVSALIGTVSVSISPIKPVFSTPSSLSSIEVGLVWGLSDVRLVVDNYVLYRDDIVIDNNVTLTSYFDNTLSEGNTYRYQVAAVLDGEESAKSDTLVIVTAAVPSISSVTPLSSSSLQINWSIAGDAPDTYTIYKNGSNTALKSVDGSLSSTNDSGLVANTEYSYEVVANFSGSDSDKSTSSSSFTLPAAPISLTPSNITTSSLRLTWSANGNAFGTTYVVCDSADCSRSTTSTSINITSISSNTSKSYMVYAEWRGDVSGLSNSSASNGPLSTSTLVSYVSDIYADMLVNTRGGNAARIPHCMGCHAGVPPSGGFSLDGGSSLAIYNELKGVNDGDSRVNTVASDYIVDCVNDGCNNGSGGMAARSSTYTFSTGEITILEKWISQGALNN